ncbi:ATP-binding protein [Actinomadura graeca]|uniref:ATP-binding protein n=1 Tax=Actinomadura graeca TaxID=2750812 RepID=A0ABX8R3I4_9ACTN|nr:ATP-binding protein [Actinomadura graeca]QXJ25622.1 ATP-binding protein [Actinomadura graeca]
MAQRLADRLATARRRGFVGRHGELARFRELLADRDAPRVVFVHGPGGVGKTALLHQFGWLGERQGRRLVRLDGRELAPVTSAVTAALGAQLGEPGGDPPAAIGEVPGLLLLIDTLEALAPLDRWLREELMPRLPADALAVLSGRDRPSLGWRADPGWRELLETMPLGNLDPADGRRMLAARGFPDADGDAALAFTRGHPLALALVADARAQRGSAVAPAAPDVIAALLRTLVDTVPSPGHRAALEACAQVLGLTEPLLAAMLDRPGTAPLFDWLRDLSIIEHGTRGLYPHDLVREVLAAEARWRNPDGHAAAQRRAAAYYRAQFQRAEPAAQRNLLLDFAYLHRDRSVLKPFLGNLGPGGTDADTLQATAAADGDRPLLRSWVAAHEGAEAAALFDHWAARQPGGILVVRDEAGEPAGFSFQLAVEDMDDRDRRADPVAAAVAAHLERDGGLSGPETARLVRFWMDRDAFQDISRVQTFITLQLSRSYLSTPFLAGTFLTFRDPDFWADGCGHLDYHRIPSADAEIGGRRYGVYGHDWRRVPPLAWLSLMADREARPPAAGEPPLDRTAFAEAVRAALRDLGRADGLRDSPLLRTSLADPPGGGTDRAAALRDTIHERAGLLEASPRDRRAFRALHHTYLRPAGTQQLAAGLLGLPMTTYRRHLLAGIERLTDLLWQSELDARRR